MQLSTGFDYYVEKEMICVRTKEFFFSGANEPAFVEIFADDTMISNSRQWDMVWPDGDLWKGGLIVRNSMYRQTRID